MHRSRMWLINEESSAVALLSANRVACSAMRAAARMMRFGDRFYYPTYIAQLLKFLIFGRVNVAPIKTQCHYRIEKPSETLSKIMSLARVLFANN